MANNPLESLADYSRFVAELSDRPLVKNSMVSVWSTSPYTGVAEGEIFFYHGFRLRIKEELDFGSGLITSYGYESYKGQERLYWYDDFPHPNDSSLAPTFPHHKHVPPDIKRNRVPAPEISFAHPNLQFVIQELEKIIEKDKSITKK
ncbi:MAG: hypothetical protein B6D61_03420 [Bacteroidetes bacterium 4484_249]|nr:MAG: hypothetical protein B6D61_03420 [Bacteroidetes bacterium 4484_249]